MSPGMRPSSRLAAALFAATLAAGCGHATPADFAIPLDASVRPVRANAYVRPLGAAVNLDAAHRDATYRHVLTATFTSVTPENALKWNVVEPEQNTFEFAQMDALAAYAQATGKRIRGHPLLWHDQLPHWLTNGGLTRAQLAAVIRRHVRTVVAHYRGRVAEWDVVNEPLDQNGRLRTSLFFNVLGADYIDIAFRAAHRADPEAKLFLNQIGAEPPSSSSRALLKLMRRLKRRGVPVDGVGLQNHRLDGSMSTRRQFQKVFAQYRRLGLKVAITEMDMPIRSAAQLPSQTRSYQQAAEACAAAPNCTGLTVWGVTDKYSWLGSAGEPLLFDEQARPKPSFYAVLKALRH
jgi:endo-1,4-beta-xylanase